ncbi:MAG TPA: DUF6789 family protein [Devosiaceae bacterium]|nr:DUF6789 family protein [Devosiaceae bacterium]
MNAKIVNGLIAGFVATMVLSVLMVMKTAMGLMPELDTVVMLSAMMNSPIWVGWLAHFMIGTVAWGGAYALINSSLPSDSHWVKGVAFGVIAWLAMMILVMPMAGAGLFGLTLGIMAPVATLALHLVFGAVLGGTYGWLSRRAADGGALRTGDLPRQNPSA